MNLIKTTEVTAREPLTTTTQPNVETPQHGVRTYDNDRLAGICYCVCAFHAECMISTAYRGRSVLGGACQLIAIVAIAIQAYAFHCCVSCLLYVRAHDDCRAMLFLIIM